MGMSRDRETDSTNADRLVTSARSVDVRRTVRRGLWRRLGSTLKVLPIAAAIVAAQGFESSFAFGEQFLWENRGQSAPSGVAPAIATEGNIVVASGAVCNLVFTLSTCDWFVRAHDAKTGTTLWEDLLDFEGGFDRTQDVVVTRSRVFASGWVRSIADGVDFVVRSYDLQSGALLWMQRIARGSRQEFAEVIAAQGERVFAAGRIRGSSGTDDFTIIAFDATTGAPLWESATDPANSLRIDIVFAITAQGDRVFVSGLIDNGFSGLVRAHDAATGAILWEDVIPDAAPLNVRSIAAQGNLVFVPSSIANDSGGFDAIIRTYRADSGALVWEDRLSSGTGFGETVSVDVGGDRLFATSYDRCDSATFIDCHWVVRAYDQTTGALLWEDRFIQAPGGDAFPSDLVSSANRVAVVGTVLQPGGAYNATLRVYDARTGELQWQDASDPGALLMLATRGNRIFGSGRLDRSDGGSDFVVRAWEFK